MHEGKPLPAVENGRDSLGRFGPGNRAAVGRSAGEAARLRAIVRQAVTDADLVGLLAAMVEQARAGDVTAARLVLEYAIGRPRPIEDDLPDPSSVCIRLEFDQGG